MNVTRLVGWCALGLNVGAVGTHLLDREWGQAGLQAVVVLLLVVVLWGLPKVDQWLDAKLGEAVCRRQMHDAALETMRAAMADRKVGVKVTDRGLDISVH